MSKFKVGDRVVVTDGTHKSKLGIIIEVNGTVHLVRLDEGFREVWIQASRLASLSQCQPVQDDDEADGKPTMTAECGTVTDLDEWNAANKYAREIYTLEGNVGTIDVYRVLDAFGVTDPAIQHAAKKLLMPGERGAKGVIQDLEEAAFSVKQAVELMKQKGGG